MSDIEINTTCPEEEAKPKTIYGDGPERSLLNRLDSDSFYAVLDFPKALREYNLKVCGQQKSVSLNSLELNVRDVTIPSITVEAIKTKFNGASRGESSKELSEFSDETIQFKVDDGMINYYTIHKWLALLIDQEGQQSKYSKVGYATTFTILILDQYEKPIGSFTYHGVFPTTLGSLDLTNSTSEAVYVDFTFSFDYISFDLLDKSTN